ncbi:hypothetical protein [Coleofasciculus chthonoplastes]|uniref:hypothetical protein n=1 Tax=Coleofasciculus chthonoplastes TaxID=64178 RepID=UPI0018DBC619|nr:hypothetical protein [Coleofasciculus chthonoplastes]
MVLTGMLVGNAHPTVYQEFRRAKDARFPVLFDLNCNIRAIATLTLKLSPHDFHRSLTQPNSPQPYPTPRI